MFSVDSVGTVGSLWNKLDRFETLL